MKMKKEIVPNFKAIVAEAFNIANNFNSTHLKPEHIILSIIDNNDSTAIDVFKILNVDLDNLYEAIGRQLTATDINPRVSDNKYNGKVPPSDVTKQAFNEADNEAEKLGDTNISSSHFILGLLTIPSEISGLLLEHRISYDGFFKAFRDLKIENSYMGDIDKNNDIRNDKFGNDPEGGYDFKDDIPKGSKKSDNKDTPVLDNFCRDVTKMAKDKALDPIVGREKEIKRVSQILSRRKKNNPVLIGEPGVGKTAIVEGLAQLIIDGKAPRILLGRRILALDLASVVAGTKYRGQFEERMKAMLVELQTHPEVIIFIDELHTIVGAGNSAGSLDASNIFKPALARGELQCIGATTLDEYRENIEKDGALVRRFQQVLVEAPSLAETEIILKNIKEKYEDHHKVRYTDEAILECVKLSDRYITDRAMPDKAIDVMDEAGASTNVSFETPENIKELEAEREATIAEKLEVVQKQQYEKAAKLRDKEVKVEAKLEEARKEWLASLDKKRTVIDVEIVADVISTMTGIPLSKISVKENKRLLEMEKELTGVVIGQDEVVTKVAKAIKRNRLGIKDKNKPIGSFIFLGPTGVGKTYMAKVLAEYMFGDADAMVRIDMSEYMEKHTVSRLIGAPPGYVGYEQGGQLTEKIRRKPYSVILFDEIEKAHDDVFNVLLQLLDEGQLTDGLGRKVNFKNTMIIMTSNIGVREAMSFGQGIGFGTKDIGKVQERTSDIIEKSLKKKFRPEFLNRLDDTMIFNTLTREDIAKIINLELKKLNTRIKEMGYDMKVDKTAVEYITDIGYSEEYGARPLARAIQKHIEDNVCEEILAGNIKEGDVIKVSYNKTKDKISIKPEKTKKTGEETEIEEEGAE